MPSAGFGRWFDPRQPFLVPLLVLFATRAWMMHAIPTANEDAYITFRYAANWAAGLGPVFNAGERVLGFTSPLWTALLALGIRFGADPVVFSRALALAGDVLVLCAVGALLSRHVSRTAAWLFTGFWSAYPFFSAITASGLETGFVVALLALAAWGIDRGYAFAGVTLGLLALSRPEGLVMALVLGIWARGRDRITGGAIALAGIAGLVLAFGNPLPQSMLAKASLYGTPGPWAGRHWWEWLVPVVLSSDAASSEGGNLRLLSVVLFAGFVAGVPELWRQRRHALAGAALALLTVWAGYAALGVAYFYWYLVLPLAGCAIVSAVGIARATRGPALPVAFLISVSSLWTIVGTLYVGRAGTEASVSQILSGLLERQARPGESILLEPIGMIGWRNPGLRVLDEIGLVSPEIARRRKDGPGWYSDVVLRAHPDWLLSRRGVLVHNQSFAGAGLPFRSLTERDQVLSFYRLAAAQDTLLGDQAWVIYQRRRVP